MGLIRAETPGDREAVHAVNCAAFQGEAEARLADRLRDEGVVIVSLVAEEDGVVAGHILFSEITIETATGTIRAAALAPMAVGPEHQCRGIGSTLVREGLEACRKHGYSAVIVVGHPSYYPRFGFSAKLAEKLRSPYSGDACMAVELTPNALEGVEGTVRYPEAFSSIE